MNKLLLTTAVAVAVVAFSAQSTEARHHHIHRPHIGKHIKKMMKHCVGFDKEHLCISTKGLCRWAKAAYTGDTSRCVYGAADMLSSGLMSEHEVEEELEFAGAEVVNTDSLQWGTEPAVEDGPVDSPADAAAEEEKPKPRRPRHPKKPRHPKRPEEAGREHPRRRRHHRRAEVKTIESEVQY